MARAITAGELANLRKDGQWSELYLAILNPATVYSARVNQAFTAWDSITQLTYDGGSGTLASVQVGMTLWIGSSAGAYDKGMCRIRSAPTATVMYIGETSDVSFADNDYLTVVNEYTIWPRLPRVVSDVTYMDYDIAYAAQHANTVPVIRVGPDAVLWLTGATVAYTPTATAWSPDGTSVTSWAWTATGASATSGMTTASPTITYNAAGTYTVTCTGTTSAGQVKRIARNVFVYSAAAMPITQFVLGACSGSFGDGGWSFDVAMYAEATLTTVRDRAKVILFARDYYGDTQTSIGPVAGAENIIVMGWIAGDSITWSPETSTVAFSVRGPSYWLDKCANLPVGVKYTASAATAWTEYASLTVDSGAWHQLEWRTTALTCIDWYNSGDTRTCPACEGQAGSVWQQIKQITEAQILATPLCDRYGRLYTEIDSQFLTASERVTASIPVVMAVTANDWQDVINLERTPRDQVSMLDISGVTGAAATPLFSRAAGTATKRHGAIQSRDRLLFSNQAGANNTAGLLLGWLNNEYPAVDIRLAQNNRMLDICPRQYFTLTIATADTPRGISFTAKQFIPRQVQYNQAAGGFLAVQITGEAETFQELSVTVTRPQTPVNNTPPQPTNTGTTTPGIQDPTEPTWPIIPTVFPPSTPPPVVPLPPNVDDCKADLAAVENGPFSLFISGDYSNSADPVFVPFPCALRSPGATYKTTYQLIGVFQERDTEASPLPDWTAATSDDWYHVYAIGEDGKVIAEGVHDAVTDTNLRTGTFNNVAAVDIAGIMLEFDPVIQFNVQSVYYFKPLVINMSYPAFQGGGVDSSIEYPPGMSVPFTWQPDMFNEFLGTSGQDQIFATPFMGYAYQVRDHIYAGWSMTCLTGPDAGWPELDLGLWFTISTTDLVKGLFSGRWWHFDCLAQHLWKANGTVAKWHPYEGQWQYGVSNSTCEVITTNPGGEDQNYVIYQALDREHHADFLNNYGLMYKWRWRPTGLAGGVGCYGWYRVEYACYPLPNRRILVDNFNLYNICAAT